MPADGRAGCLSRWGGRPWGREGGALPCAAGWGRRAQSISRWGRGPPRGRASAPVSSPTERSALWREKRGKQARDKWPRTLRHLQPSLWRWPGTPTPPPPVSSALGAAVATGAGPCRGGRAGSCHLLPGVVSGPLALGREAPLWPKTLPGGAWLAHGFVQGAVCPADRLPDGLRSTVLACGWVLGQGQCGESYPDVCAFGAMRFCQVRLLVGVNKEDEQPADTTLISCKLSILYGAGSMGVA